MPKTAASAAPIHQLPLTDWGDFFRPNPCPIMPDEVIEPFHPGNDAIGHYCGYPGSPPVFRRAVGWLAGTKVTGKWDVIVCPEMCLRVEIPRTIRTWGELHKYLTELVGPNLRSSKRRRIPRKQTM